MTIPFIFFIVALASFVIGVKLPILGQALLFVIGLVWINSTRVRRMEIAALLPMGMFWVGTLAMLVGDVVFIVVHGLPPSMGEFFKWLFTI